MRGWKERGREGRLDWIWLDHWKSKRRWGRDGESSRCGKGNEMGGKGNGIWKSKRDWVNELVSSGDGKERWYGERNRRFGVIWDSWRVWEGYKWRKRLGKEGISTGVFSELVCVFIHFAL